MISVQKKKHQILYFFCTVRHQLVLYVIHQSSFLHYFSIHCTSNAFLNKLYHSVGTLTNELNLSLTCAYSICVWKSYFIILKIIFWQSGGCTTKIPTWMMGISKEAENLVCLYFHLFVRLFVSSDQFSNVPTRKGNNWDLGNSPFVIPSTFVSTADVVLRVKSRCL